MTDIRLTDQKLAEIGTRAAHLHEFVALPAEANQLAGTDVPALLVEVRRLQQQRQLLIDQLAKKDAASGAGNGALAEFLGAGSDIAAADNPTPLRWGLNDVLWGDGDTVTVLLSGPQGEPYWLELDSERAAVLREDLAGPGSEERRVVADDSDDPEHVDDCPASTPTPVTTPLKETTVIDPTRTACTGECDPTT
ncbi:hypothetical protein, partial [Streptomyces sp. NPDC058603]|uniref:hypothetical protein n=1 Tax=Streptomyces sp. NPDC058603 TaxID=3346551 RepID=UPI003654F10A